jgi:type III pantothenate kinase
VRATRADFLLINLNNSFTKIALASPRRVGRVERIRTAELSAAKIAAVVGDRRFSHAVLASVVPAKSAAVRSALRGKPLIEVTSRTRLNVGIDFAKPETIGADRLANAVAARELYGAPAFVVDFGTATTFDVVSREGCYAGGVIAPGLDVMTDYLHARTALLPQIRLREPRRAIGRTTQEAMIAGAVHGYRGLVREILLQLKQELPGGKRARVIATGGYAKLIAGGMPEIESVAPLLTMEGLRIIATLNA